MRWILGRVVEGRFTPSQSDLARYVLDVDCVDGVYFARVEVDVSGHPLEGARVVQLDHADGSLSTLVETLTESKT